MKKLINLWLSCFNNKDKVLYDAKGYLRDNNIWLIAYAKISKNKGALTTGPDKKTLDGISLKSLKNLRDLVLKGKYTWIGSKRIEIPKPGKKGLRPLSLPASSDKIVQEVLKIIIEPLFELNFSDSSHGFRKGRSCHTAMGQIDRDFKPVKWVIEGDIKKYFDTVDHKTLMAKVEEKIKDPLILKLISSGLKARIFFTNGTSFSSELGLPQGGILSPLLSNIYLDCFDKFMESKSELYNKGKTPKHNKQYEAARYYKKPLKGLISYDPFDSTYRKLVYVRYADDFIVGIRGPIKDAYKIKEEITKFLEQKLKISLNLEKTKISHIKSNVIFLGHRFIRKTVRVFTKFYTRKGSVFRKSKHQVFGLDGVYSKVIKKLMNLGMITFRKINKKFQIIGKSYVPFIPYPQSEIIQKYNCIIRGLSEWYKHAGNRRTILNFISYLLQYSAAKTLAQKYNTSMKKIFTLAGKDLSKPIKGLKAIGVTDQRIVEWESSIKKSSNGIAKTVNTITPIMYTQYHMIPRGIDFKYGFSWKPEYFKQLEKVSKKVTKGSLQKLEEELEEFLPKEFDFINVLTRGLNRSIKLFNASCTLCGTKNDIQIHHIKRVSSIKGKNSKEKRIKAFSMKQIPLCSSCHLTVHQGDWRKPPITPRQS